MREEEKRTLKALNEKLALQREVERLRLELENLRDERDYIIGERNDYRDMQHRMVKQRDRAIAERDDYKEQLQAKAMQIEAARRAVEIAAEHYRLWLNEESKWGNRGFLSKAADVITDALRDEFSLEE